MPGKMEEKMKEILEYPGYLGSGGIKNPGQTVSPVDQAIYELAQHIDEVEKKKEDDEFTSESDKEADLPASTTCKMAGQEHPIIVSGTGGKLKAESQANEVKLEQLWEQERDTFIQVTKSEFDALFHKKEFAGDPLSSKPSKWTAEFGPYDPEQWTFGILTNGHRRCFRIDQAELQDTPPTPEPNPSPEKEEFPTPVQHPKFPGNPKS